MVLDGRRVWFGDVLEVSCRRKVAWRLAASGRFGWRLAAGGSVGGAFVPLPEGVLPNALWDVWGCEPGPDMVLTDDMRVSGSDELREKLR